MKVLLDTCTLAEIRKPQGNPAAKTAVAEVADDDLFLSVLSVGEIANGVALLATTFKMGKGSVRGVVSVLLDAAECLVAARFRVNGALIVAVAGLLGLVLLMTPDASKPEPRR